MRQIRLDKFDLVLPQAMRDNGIDMWIVAMRESHYDPLYAELGRGYVSGTGYYIFTDRGGGRIERAALGVSGYLLEQTGAYDILNPTISLGDFVRERNPRRIGVNISDQIGPADGLTYTLYQHLLRTLPAPFNERLVSAEKVVSDFRSRRVASEIVAFGEALKISTELAERALSNEVITPGKTTLEEVAWWLQDQLLVRGLESEFDMPSIYITGPKGIEATSTNVIIQPGQILMIDWGVRLMGFATDMKRMAYVLKSGESSVPPSIQNAFDKALQVRAVIRQNIKVGRRADETLKDLNAKVQAAGFEIIEFNRPKAGASTDVVIGCHPVGNTGHDVGPSMTTWQPLQSTFVIQKNHLFAFEFFAYTPIPEWGGAKLRIPLEDDAIVTEAGVEWIGPSNRRVLMIR